MLVTFKGLNLGDGGDYVITGLDGWESRPEVTNGSSPRPHSLGSWVGGMGAQKRVVTIDLEILGLESDNYQTTIPKRKLRQIAGLSQTEEELLIGLEYGDTPEVIFARITDLAMPTRQGYGKRATAILEFTATDPRKYSTGIYTATTGVAVQSRAIAYPITYGTFPETLTPSQRGEAITENLGNAPSPAIYKITGPSPQPIITVTYPDGKQKRTQINVPLAAGEVMTVDTANGMVNVGGANRSGQTSGAIISQLEIPPGQSTVTLSGGGDATLTVQWRDANL